SLNLSGDQQMKKKVLAAPTLSLSLGDSFIIFVLLSGSGAGSLPGPDQFGLGVLEREDVVDSEGTRWRCFTTGDPPQESRVNMSVLEPYLRVLSHGGYYGDGEDDIIVFSSCYLPENSLENYQYVMDNLFRFVIGTLELMVAENYVIVYLCAGGQKEKLPGIGWLKECYTTIDRRLRKNLKGFYVVHPTWYIKIVVTIIKPFISSKFSRKLQFVNTLQELSLFIPTEHVQIPDCVRHYDVDQKINSRENRRLRQSWSEVTVMSGCVCAARLSGYGAGQEGGELAAEETP
uniref:CRAL-TRIO domain-containing protein n=1 Tax=Xiphophorus couchianus TaxID=32473 RepID=A0A3B5MQ36_9TELE